MESGGAISSARRAAWGGMRPLPTHLLVREAATHTPRRATQPCNPLNTLNTPKPQHLKPKTQNPDFGLNRVFLLKKNADNPKGGTKLGSGAPPLQKKWFHRPKKNPFRRLPSSPQKKGSGAPKKRKRKKHVQRKVGAKIGWRVVVVGGGVIRLAVSPPIK